MGCRTAARSSGQCVATPRRGVRRGSERGPRVVTPVDRMRLRHIATGRRPGLHDGMRARGAAAARHRAQNHEVQRQTPDPPGRLLPGVLRDHLRRHLTHRRAEVPPAPEMLGPSTASSGARTPPAASARTGRRVLHDLRDAQRRRTRHQNVNVVLRDVPSQDLHVPTHAALIRSRARTCGRSTSHAISTTTGSPRSAGSASTLPGANHCRQKAATPKWSHGKWGMVQWFMGSGEWFMVLWRGWFVGHGQDRGVGEVVGVGPNELLPLPHKLLLHSKAEP